MHLVVPETSASYNSIYALGDCTASQYAPTAQVASQEGAYLARVFKQLARRDALLAELEELKGVSAAEGEQERKVRIETLESQVAKTQKTRPFKYSHQGSLAYIGSEKAIADLPFMNGNVSALSSMSFLVVCRQRKCITDALP